MLRCVLRNKFMEGEAKSSVVSGSIQVCYNSLLPLTAYCMCPEVQEE